MVESGCTKPCGLAKWCCSLGSLWFCQGSAPNEPTGSIEQKAFAGAACFRGPNQRMGQDMMGQNFPSSFEQGMQGCICCIDFVLIGKSHFGSNENWASTGLQTNKLMPCLMSAKLFCTESRISQKSIMWSCCKCGVSKQPLVYLSSIPG